MRNMTMICLLLFGVCACSPATKTTNVAYSRDNPPEMRIQFEDGVEKIEVMPAFQGEHHSRFRHWVSQNISYPSAVYRDYFDGHLTEQALEGYVVAAFVVGRDGSVEDVEILSSPNSHFGQIVKYAISRSSQWTPGYGGDEPVRVRFTLPVYFRLPQSIESLRHEKEDRIRRNMSTPQRRW